MRLYNTTAGGVVDRSAAERTIPGPDEHALVHQSSVPMG